MCTKKQVICLLFVIGCCVNSSGFNRRKINIFEAKQQFYWRQNGTWADVGPPLDAAVLSDEDARGEHACFTGNFVGMVAYDTSGAGAEARFTRFSYAPHKAR